MNLSNLVKDIIPQALTEKPHKPQAHALYVDTGAMLDMLASWARFNAAKMNYNGPSIAALEAEKAELEKQASALRMEAAATRVKAFAAYGGEAAVMALPPMQQGNAVDMTVLKRSNELVNKAVQATSRANSIVQEIHLAREAEHARSELVKVLATLLNHQ